MSASTNPLVVQGTVSFPPDEGQQPVLVPFGYTGNFTQVLDSRMALVGAGTTSVPFGGIGSPGAKLVLLEYEVDPTGAAAAVTVKFNGSTDGIELQPGGFIAYANPAPGTSITAISLVRTADAVIRVRLFG